MDIAKQMAADIAIRLNGGEFNDGKWYSEEHRKAWIYAVQLHADKIEYLMKLHDDMADELERFRTALLDVIYLLGQGDSTNAMKIASVALENRKAEQ